MTTPTDRRGDVNRFGGLQIAISVLTAATAIVHGYLAVLTTMLVVNDPTQAQAVGGTTVLSVFAALFFVSFLGYVALLVALYLPALHRFRRPARWALIGWAAGNIVAYFLAAQGQFDAFALSNKATEVLLIVLLLIEDRRRSAVRKRRDLGAVPQ